MDAFEDVNNTELKNMLDEWDLSHMFKHFIEQKVTIQVLKILQTKHIERLFQNQPIGDQVIFEHKLELWKQGILLAHHSSSNKATNIGAIKPNKEPIKVIEVSPYPYSNRTPIVKTVPLLQTQTTSCPTTPQVSTISNFKVSTPTATITTSTPSFNDSLNNSQYLNTSFNASIKPTPSLPTQPQQDFTKPPRLFNAAYVAPCRYSLRNILEETSGGQVIVNYYEKHKILREEHRAALINVIARYIDANGCGLSLSESNQIESQIVEMFPTEKEEFYRTNKRGRIYNKIANMKRVYKKFNKEAVEPSTSTVTSERSATSSPTSPICVITNKSDDDPIQSLLQNWGLEHMLHFFKDENINANVLKLMDENDLNELASKMAFGDKITFKHNFEKWRSDLNIAHHNSLTIRSKSLSPSTSHSSSFSDDEEYSNTKVCVMKILQQHNIGCKILEMYETTKEITPEHRNLMISIIVEYFQSKDMHMETQTSYNIESQILKIFPNEKLSFYRTGRRGKIYTKYINNKRLLKSFKKPSEHRPNNEVYVPQGEDEILTKRLRYDDLPAEEFYSAWSACAKLRFNQIKNDCQTMGEIFTLWPQYKETLGVKLIDIDFNQMFETNYNTLDWKENFINIFKQLKRGAKARDVNFKQMMDSIDVDDLDNDSKNTYLKILWCLHYILFQTRKEVQSETDGKRKYKTFSVRDSQYAFIYISETMQSLENHVAELQKKKQPIQPFILGLGDMKSLQVSKYFVYLDGQYLPFTSFVRAVDICFKAIQLFNLEYPLACRPMWIFIEQFLYKLNKSTEKVSKVSLLINELEKY